MRIVGRNAKTTYNMTNKIHNWHDDYDELGDWDEVPPKKPSQTVED